VNRLQQLKARLMGQPSSAPIYLIVGLGNPGPKYARNRHNVGFQSVDRLAESIGIKFAEKKRFKALVGEGQIGAHRVVLAKPLTFMNDSGQAVRAISHWYKTPPDRILIIYDDLDLPLGKTRLRPDGKSGGHNGLNSIIREMGTSDIPRLRIGIGRPVQGDPVDYVLGDFSRDQEPVILETLSVVESIVRCLLEQGILRAMDAFNGAPSPATMRAPANNKEI